MATPFFSPFKKLLFNDHTCFMTGKPTTGKLTVFPRWLMDKYEFGKDEFEMIEKERQLLYEDLVLPASQEVIEAFEKLDEEVEIAFKNGYEGVTALPQLRLFQWIGRIVYGVLYHELTAERAQKERLNKEFGLSADLRNRFGVFHLMLQSILGKVKIVEGAVSPWTIKILRQKFTSDIFGYRDDAVNLLFNIRTDKFGIIAVLEDNGAILGKEQELLNKISEDTVLHPIQFEEIYARFHFADWVQLYKPQYKIERTEDLITVEALPIEVNESRPLFGFWDEHLFAQLLANYWEVYGFQVEDIQRDHRPIMTYLEDPYSKEFIDPESIKLPY